ncbi:hypothetical protein BOTBODRAFT_27492 [Botryobasidium botryosum FD-172 SS1]|uniref:Uncharacterized protein n=1 Tax=Botryobasidium botryosum (strain FD-172 SS1) TaxID=930990 RepID=A0A067MZD2_BOTB1|nr:hypothetical protein BOTBODRAFT_27492 [Botryobasidium botryosum FD-172 SS1]
MPHFLVEREDKSITNYDTVTFDWPFDDPPPACPPLCTALEYRREIESIIRTRWNLEAIRGMDAENRMTLQRERERDLDQRALQEKYERLGALLNLVLDMQDRDGDVRGFLMRRDMSIPYSSEIDTYTDMFTQIQDRMAMIKEQMRRRHDMYSEENYPYTYGAKYFGGPSREPSEAPEDFQGGSEQKMDTGA